MASKTWTFTFENGGSKTVEAADTIDRLVAVGTDRNRIVEVTIGDRVSAIADDCFRGMTHLTKVNGGAACESIGNRAFEGCTRLSSCEIVANGTTPVTFIGEKAFANTDLRALNINLYGAVYFGGIEDQAFASCRNLTSLIMSRSSLLPPNGFRGCSSLVEVSIPNSTSYVYDGTFAECSSLESIQIPSKIQSLGAEMFMNCPKLKDVSVQDTSDNPSILKNVGANAFSGCPLITSFTLPRSISSISQISPQFLSGSNIQELHLDGIADEVIQSTSETRTSYATDKYGYIINRNIMVKAFQDAVKRNIPVIFITNHDLLPKLTGDCPHCKNLLTLLTSSKWKTNIMQQFGKYCYFFYTSFLDDQSTWMELSFQRTDGTFPNVFKYNGFYAKMAIYWKKSSKSIINKTLSYESKSIVTDLRAILQKATVETGNVSETVTTNISKFGSPLKQIRVTSSTNKWYTISADSQSQQYIPPPLDMSTSNFKPGIWYGKPRELKEHVDQTNAPCFIEFSDAGCPPCKEFRDVVYGNPDFQAWVAKQNIYFCRLETETHSEFEDVESDAYYIRNTWAKQTTKTIPILMYYWMKPDGSEVWDIESIHDRIPTWQELTATITAKLT